MQPHYSQPSRNNPMSLKNKLTKQNATIQQVLILKFDFKPENLPDLPRNRPQNGCFGIPPF